MDPWISLVTLGARDVEGLTRFYGALGWRPSAASVEGVVTFFHSGGAVLSIFGREDLASEARIEDGGAAFGGIALAHNVASREQVDAVLAEVAIAGGTVTKPAEDTPWGGYSGYFADPEGHPWEVAWNPGFPLDAEGRVTLPE